MQSILVLGLVEKDDAFFSRFLEDKEVVIYSSIENSNQKLFRLLEFIVEEAGGFVSTDIGMIHNMQLKRRKDLIISVYLLTR